MVDNFITFNFDKEKKSWITNFNPKNYERPIKLRTDLINSKDGKKVLKRGSKINLVIANKLFDEGLKNISFTSDYFIGKYIKMI